MAKRKRRFKSWFRRESALEEVQPQASVQTLPGVEAESAQPVPDEVQTEPPTEAPEAGVEALLVAMASSDGGEPQSAAPEPEGVEVQISAGAAEAVEVQLPPESVEEVPPQPSSEAPEDVVAQFVVQAPPETRAQEAAEAPPEVETVLTPEEEAALRDQEAATRRQYARFRVGGKTKGRVTAIYDAVVVNISIGGSLIEHAHVVRPGTLSSLDLDILGKRLRLKCRVARSVVHGSQVLPTGERELIYRTGLEFLEMSDAIRQMIGRYIQSMVNEEPH
ncbi:MAG TPA: PilZ domain-containing protein [Candidatus Methylomirabilis sp.]|nr:PilZ domain-containing protein [Candidatus Methylomirabilis sp.]